MRPAGVLQGFSWNMSSPADFRTRKITKHDIRIKMLREASGFLKTNFTDFCFHFDSPNSSEIDDALDFFVTYFPRQVEDGSKMTSRQPKTPSRHLQDTSKTSQDASKIPPTRPQTAQRCLQVISSCPETRQECHKFDRFEQYANFQCLPLDFSILFIFSGFLWRGKDGRSQ